MSTTAIPARKKFRVSPPLIMLAAVVVIAAVVAFFMLRPKEQVDPFHVTPVSRGTITKSVSASGTLQALVTVDVGSQVNGQVQDVLVDFDSHVTKGQVLARLDPQTYKTRLDSSNADMSSTRQSIASAEANLAQAQANAKVVEADYARNKSLAARGYVSDQALQQSEAQLASAQASIKVQQAAVNSAKARLLQSEASVRTANIDVSHTVILSPITGIVVDRKVDPGQTVVSSMSAQTLFKIAQDLSKLQLKILVDEADIGNVAVGQTVNFTVDAFPDQRFQGVITQVRKQPETQNNVVAYDIIAQADNPDGRLLPGMTTNAQITLERHPGVMRVPNAALRWVPVDLQTPAPAPGGFGGGGRPGGGPGGGGFAGPGGGGGGGGGGGARGGGRGGRGNPMAVYDQIDLTDSQIDQIDKIQAEARKLTRARQDKAQKDQARGVAVDRQALVAEMRKSTEETRAKIDALLTPAQKAQAETIRSGAAGPQLPRGQVYVMRNNEPHRVGVGLGATDGANTEVISSRLKLGDLVITSGGPKPKPLKASGSPLGGPAGGQRRGG